MYKIDKHLDRKVDNLILYSPALLLMILFFGIHLIFINFNLFALGFLSLVFAILLPIIYAILMKAFSKGNSSKKIR
jgi:hypothetical protein